MHNIRTARYHRYHETLPFIAYTLFSSTLQIQKILVEFETDLQLLVEFTVLHLSFLISTHRYTDLNEYSLHLQHLHYIFNLPIFTKASTY